MEISLWECRESVPLQEEKEFWLDKKKKILADSLDQNPELSNKYLAALVDFKIAPRTISDYLLRQ